MAAPAECNESGQENSFDLRPSKGRILAVPKRFTAAFALLPPIFICMVLAEILPQSPLLDGSGFINCVGSCPVFHDSTPHLLDMLGYQLLCEGVCDDVPAAGPSDAMISEGHPLLGAALFFIAQMALCIAISLKKERGCPVAVGVRAVLHVFLPAIVGAGFSFIHLTTVGLIPLWHLTAALCLASSMMPQSDGRDWKSLANTFCKGIGTALVALSPAIAFLLVRKAFPIPVPGTVILSSIAFPWLFMAMVPVTAAGDSIPEAPPQRSARADFPTGGGDPA